MATRNFLIAHVAHIVLLLDSVVLDRSRLQGSVLLTAELRPDLEAYSLF